MNTADMQIVRISGDPLVGTRQFCDQAGSLVQRGIAVWLRQLEEMRQLDDGGDQPAVAYLRKFLAETDYLPACERWVPDLMEEIRVIAGTLDIPFDVMFAAQLHDEEWLYARRNQFRLRVGETERCTTLGAIGPVPGRAIIGQNMDIGQWADGLQLLVLHDEYQGKPKIAAFTVAGNAGLCGMNSAGVGICCNTLMQLPNRTDGLPVAFIVRKVLQQNSFADARALLAEVPHASGQNYLIGGPGAVASLECGAEGVTEFWPTTKRDRTYHTNHCLAGDWAFASKGDETAEASGSPTTIRRFAAVERAFGNSADAVSVPVLKQTLSLSGRENGPVSCEGNPVGPASGEHIGFTFGSLVMDLSDQPHLHIAAGPPTISSYIEMRLG